MKRLICIALIILSVSSIVYSQGKRKIELTAQGILARVDRVLQYPDGQIIGRMKHIRPDGHSFTLNIKAAIARDNSLFVFNSRKRGDQLKVLYNLGGEDIWVYNIHAIKLYHKLGIDKYDAVLGTNFSFLDLSSYDLQSNYTASIEGDAFIKGYDAYKLRLNPIFKGGLYGMLTLYVSKDEFIPLRIDFHDRDKAIYKFLTITKIRKYKGRIVPIRYDMMDIRRGTITILRFFKFDDRMKFKREVFRSEKLGG